MGALSRWAVRKPVLALVAWFIAMAGVIGIGTHDRLLGVDGPFTLRYVCGTRK